MGKSVFEKISDALKNGTGVSLSNAEIELLVKILDDAFGNAETAYDRWREIFDDYERNAKSERQGSE